ALVYAATVLLAVAAPPIVLWIVLVVAGRFGLSELRELRAGRASLVFGAVFFVGLFCLGLLKAAGALGAPPGTPESLPVWLILAIVSTWAADVAAYLVGTAVGRHRIAPSISPGKTLEGTVAGFVACALAVLAVGVAFGLPRGPVTIVAIGLGPVGLAGDLLESFVKRRAGVKDSGSILPGHGGLLDRLDSLVAGAIFVDAVLVAGVLSGFGGEGGIVDRF
ncbi:MAG TPA: phosphatidate cytidylyltransferase, partial [Candidatus Limnocylindria bacterium]|nr:phosphatidate cytidylyltransferase [Candidatus Limnocylindria bacterium]